jgi:hypothetical protein
MQLCMLVAGPDWLTGVLSGMHNTNVWRILSVQMAPTTLLIAGPATMAGAFQVRVSEGGAWLATSSLLLFFAAACQARCWLVLPRPAMHPLIRPTLQRHRASASCTSTIRSRPPQRSMRKS